MARVDWSFVCCPILGHVEYGSSDVSWSPDTIEGRITVIYLPQLFKRWTHKYPRGHYLVSAIFYLPMIKKWEANPVPTRLPDGKVTPTALDQKRLYKLATVTRKISVIMSVGILLAVFLTARKLFDDDLAAILSVLCLALSCHFTFYSKSGCVDIPAFFWFAWAGCFGLYAIKSGNLACYLLAGFCSAWSVCTKEGVATFHVGLAAGLSILLVYTKMQSGQRFKKAFLSLIHWKVLAGIAIAVFVFFTLEGFLGGMEEWHYRSGFWSERTKSEFISQGVGNIVLLERTYRSLSQGWGSPFFILLLLSLAYWVVKYRWQLCLTVLPLLAFFFLTVLIVRQNLPRFMMCGYAGIAILMGKTLADWYRSKRVPMAVRYILPLFVLVPSLICCICYGLEMKHDTRVRAEKWMIKNAAPGVVVGLSMRYQYAPRLWIDGFRAIPQWDSKGIATQNGKVQVWPDYIVGSNQWPCASTVDKDFFRKMFRGETDYQERGRFDKLYFKKDTLLWKYCLRFYDLHAGISPRMIIYKKNS
jgi:hypothetical protein